MWPGSLNSRCGVWAGPRVRKISLRRGMERIFFPDGVAGMSNDVREGSKVRGLFES